MSKSYEESINGATFKPLTKSLSKQLSRQVIYKNASCFDNLSCHGSMPKVDKINDGSIYGSNPKGDKHKRVSSSIHHSSKSRAKSSAQVTRNELETIEREQAVLEKKIVYLKERLKLDEYLQRINMNEEKEQDEAPERSNSPVKDTDHKVHNYLQNCTLASHQPKLKAVQEEEDDDATLSKTVSLKSTSETVTHQPKEVDTANLASLVDIDKDEFTLVETVSLVTTSETGIKQPKDLDLANPSLIVKAGDEDEASLIKNEVIESEVYESSSITLQQELETRKYEDRKLLCPLTLVDKGRLNRFATKPYNINVCRQKILPLSRIDTFDAGDDALILEVAEISLIPDELSLLLL